MAADPSWSFDSNPTKAVSHASTRAADADSIFSRESARYWTEVGVRLVALADNPHVRVGQVLGQLAAKYGVPV